MSMLRVMSVFGLRVSADAAAITKAIARQPVASRLKRYLRGENFIRGKIEVLSYLFYSRERSFYSGDCSLSHNNYNNRLPILSKPGGIFYFCGYKKDETYKTYRNRMKRIEKDTIGRAARAVIVPAMMVAALAGSAQSVPAIEVTGSATVNIVPDRITIEIGMEEYYRPTASGDSMLVRLPEIEKHVRKTLSHAGVADSMIVVTDMSNRYDRYRPAELMMGKRLSATVADFNTIEDIAGRIDRKGISCFNIAKIDNTEIERYNRQGLKAALDAAREKAEFIADNEGLSLNGPYEIVENGPNYYDTPEFTNVSIAGGSGMDGMRRIVRRYSVKVRYGFSNR